MESEVWRVGLGSGIQKLSAVPGPVDLDCTMKSTHKAHKKKKKWRADK